MSNYRRFIPEGKTVFIGIDLHQRSWHVTTLVEDQVVFSSNIPPEAEAFFKLLKHFGRNPIEEGTGPPPPAGEHKVRPYDYFSNAKG